MRTNDELTDKNSLAVDRCRMCNREVTYNTVRKVRSVSDEYGAPVYFMEFLVDSQVIHVEGGSFCDVQ